MVAMNPRLVVLLLCASLLPAVQAAATILPDSCGPDEIKFKIDKAKPPVEGQPNPAPAPPAAGKAQIIFIEYVDNSGPFFTTPTTRFGVDGKWVGANKGDSYFAVEVGPGLHRFCVNWQSDDKLAKKVGMAKITAEAGKVYYFEILINRKRFGGGGGFVPGASGPGVTNGGGGFVGGGSSTDISFTFSQVDEDEGAYRLKASTPSTWKIETDD
jgi:hypothetical protein